VGEFFGKLVGGMVALVIAAVAIMWLVQMALALVAVASGAAAYLYVGKSTPLVRDEDVFLAALRAVGYGVAAAFLLLLASDSLMFVVYWLKFDLYKKWVELSGGREPYSAVKTVAYFSASTVTLLAYNRLYIRYGDSFSRENNKQFRSNRIFAKVCAAAIGLVVFAAVEHHQDILDIYNDVGFYAAAIKGLEMWPRAIVGAVVEPITVLISLFTNFSEFTEDFYISLIATKGDMFNIMKVMPKAFAFLMVGFGIQSAISSGG
jgi:hypothetical protein